MYRKEKSKGKKLENKQKNRENILTGTEQNVLSTTYKADIWQQRTEINVPNYGFYLVTQNQQFTWQKL